MSYTDEDFELFGEEREVDEFSDDEELEESTEEGSRTEYQLDFVQLSPTYIYFEGLIIHTTSTAKKQGPFIMLASNNQLRDVNLNSLSLAQKEKKDEMFAKMMADPIICFSFKELTEHCPSTTEMYLVRTEEGVTLSDRNPGGSYIVPVFEVSIKGNKKCQIYIDTGNGSIQSGNDMGVKFKTHDTEDNNSYLARLLNTYDLTSAQIKLLQELVDSPLIDEGVELYDLVSQNAFADSNAPCYYYPKSANATTITPFLNRHCSSVDKRYAKFFGWYYAWISRLNSDATITVKYEVLLKLFEYFIMKNPNPMTMILLPYLANIENGRLHVNDMVIKKMQALKTFVKRAVFLVIDTIKMFDPSWARLVDIFQKIIAERGDYEKFKVIEYPNGDLYVDRTIVKVEYFTTLYNKAVEDFRNKFRTIGQLIGDVHTIQEVYEQFISRKDRFEGSLISAFKYAIFYPKPNVDKKKVI
ncbi:hypothetical protein JA1_003978, partial [Spathaspora sp. JA1]